MEKYLDLRTFSFNNGGKNSDSTNEEYNKRYNSLAAIRLPFKINNIDSFVMYNDELMFQISSIYQKNNKINRILNSVPSIAYRGYIIKSLIEEIQQSNEFENVESTRQEIKSAYDNSNPKKSYRFSGMVNKYNMLIDQKYIKLNTSSDVRTLYDEFVLDEVRAEEPNDAPDGEIFRKDIIKVVGKTLGDVHYGLYPESKIIETMNQSLSFANNGDIDILIRVAVFHFMFGYIHPFYNGNGRMARFISSYQLSEHINLVGCLRISYIIKENRAKYQRLFKNAEDERTLGDITGFVIGFLELINLACDDVINDLIEKTEKYKYQHDCLYEVLENNLTEIAAKYYKIFDVILENTVFIGNGVSIDDIKKETNFSKNTISKVLNESELVVFHDKIGKKHMWFSKPL